MSSKFLEKKSYQIVVYRLNLNQCHSEFRRQSTIFDPMSVGNSNNSITLVCIYSTIIMYCFRYAALVMKDTKKDHHFIL